MLRRLTALVALAALATAQEAASVRDLVLPSKAEQAWQSISWRPTLWDAVVDAHKARKPILLWTMNGHPLGLT
jgi:hypothetical protein